MTVTKLNMLRLETKIQLRETDEHVPVGSFDRHSSFLGFDSSWVQRIPECSDYETMQCLWKSESFLDPWQDLLSEPCCHRLVW